LLNYLANKWSLRVKEDFARKIKSTIDKIRQNPEGFPKSEINNNQHKCVVTKQTTIYYRFNRNEIRILALFDTRMNPEKIKKIK
jgi:plasmid stabilization system protein ParE